MPLRTILVCLLDRDSAVSALHFAVPLAHRHGAHLIGLHSLEALVVYPAIAMHVPETVFIDFSESQKAEADAIRKIFDERMRGQSFPSEWRLLTAETTSAADRIIESAHAADLVVMPSGADGKARLGQSEIQSRVIQRCGRPVIVVPAGYRGEATARTIVLGWRNTREATRAAHDLVALAEPGSRVDILRVDGSDLDEMSDHVAMEMAQTLDRHGLSTRVVHRERKGRDVSGVLESHAFENGADLICVGAFGHSRAYDFVIGAVTRDLLGGTSLPVLFST